jgi:glucose/arabinose dehydrogenase
VFIVEQVGVIRILQDGQVLDPPFLDLRDRVGAQSNEQGLLGLAFHPDYAANGYFFVNYTDFRGDTHLARFQRADDPNRADPGSEMELLTVRQPYPNHNGGGLVFGPEGNLYAGLGDGGSAGDPQGNGQATDTLLGKVLRLDVNVEPYGIPADNPFVNGGGRPEIWAYGLRNPWRLAFDGQTGDLYIGDVGQNAWEEINFQPAGAPGGLNYGWVYREGRHPYQGNPPADLSLVEPVAEYDHGQGCSVTGGVVYRGAELPAWQGVYLYGDYCTGRVWGLLRGADGGFQNAFLFATDARISSFGVDEAGEVYLVDLGGNVYRLVSQ